MRQQDDGPSKSPKDDPNNITNILSMVISILDWLKDAGQGKQMECPGVCEVSVAIDKLREMTENLSPSPQEQVKCKCDDEIEEYYEPQEDMACEGECPDIGNVCRGSECKKCCKSKVGEAGKEPKKVTSSEQSKGRSSPAAPSSKTNVPTSPKVTKRNSLVAATPPADDLENIDEILKLTVSRIPPEKRRVLCPKEYPVVAKALKECAQCCQTSAQSVTEPTIVPEKKVPQQKLNPCKCPPPSHTITMSRMNQSNVTRDDKKIQAQQFKILYDQRKALLDSIYNPANRYQTTTKTSYSGRTVVPKSTIEDVYKSLQPTYATSEEETADEDDEEMYYDTRTRPPSPPARSLIPTRQTQQPVSAPYQPYYPQYFPSAPYQASRIAQRNYYYKKTSAPYSYYKPYQGMGYSYGSRPSSPPKPAIPLYGQPIRTTINDYVSPGESRGATPPVVPSSSPICQNYSPPTDCAQKLIEAIMRNPTCPGYETLKKATSSAGRIPQGKAREEPKLSGKNSRESPKTDDSGCDDDCSGLPKKSGSATK